MPSKAKTSKKDTEKEPKKPGGNTWLKYAHITNDQRANLETCASMGLTITEACAIAGVSRRSFYNYCKKHNDFLPKFKMLQKKLIAFAKKNVAFSIFSEDGKPIVENSWRFLQHKRELSRIGLEKHDQDPEEGIEWEEIEVPQIATYQESMSHLKRLLLPSGQNKPK